MKHKNINFKDERTNNLYFTISVHNSIIIVIFNIFLQYFYIFCAILKYLKNIATNFGDIIIKLHIKLY